MNKISKLSNLLVLSMAAAIPLLAPTAQAQRFSTSEQTIAESSSFLDAHPDLRFRADDRFDEALRIDRLLDDPRVRRDLEPRDDTEEKDLES